MTEFEVLLVPLSLILGLGITRVLSGYVNALRGRNRVKVHWMPILWSASILAFNIGYFNVLFDIYTTGQSWTWLLFGTTLFQTSLLYFSAGMIFPSAIDSKIDMLEDFAEHGRLALIPIGILLGSAPAINYIQTPGPIFDIVEATNVALTAMIVVFFSVRSLRWQGALTIVFLGITIIGWLFIWASPGRA